MGVDDEIEETENKLHNLKQQKCLNYEQEKLQRTKTYEEYLEKYGCFKGVWVIINPSIINLKIPFT